MTNFEKFHPVIIPNFRFDWLTQSDIKQINQLFNTASAHKTRDIVIPPTLIDTVHYVNETMRQVMNRQQLTWGITQTEATDFVGIINLLNINDANTATIAFILAPQLSKTAVQAIIKRGLEFIADHFAPTAVTISIEGNAFLADTLIAMGFTSPNGIEFTYQLV